MNSDKKHSRDFVLVTGGTGYIGSHTVVALINAGYNPIIVDNLSNSKAAVVQRITQITGYKPPFYQIDLRDTTILDKIFQKHKITSIIHFAGLKAVGESIAEPLRYYENNILGSISLFFVMGKRNVKRIIFSSSAAVYGEASTVPIREDAPTAPTNPYARTKLIIENILQDVYVNDPIWQIVLLRYFNPVGAHETGLIGEDPQGIPNNLVPYISQVAVGRRKHINVFGNDYPTRDGTGVRDYIHVMDLAEGHVAALRHMEKADSSSRQSLSFPRRRESRNLNANPLIVNLGTGRGYSVLEMIQAFAKASGKEIPYKITKRRSGDIAACFADTALAKKRLGWKARRGLNEMCAAAWNWQSKNPNGY